MRAMRGKTLETVPFQPYFWVHKKLPQSTVKLVLPSNESYESKTGCNGTLATILWVPLSSMVPLGQGTPKHTFRGTQHLFWQGSGAFLILVLSSWSGLVKIAGEDVSTLVPLLSVQATAHATSRAGLAFDA